MIFKYCITIILHRIHLPFNIYYSFTKNMLQVYINFVKIFIITLSSTPARVPKILVISHSKGHLIMKWIREGQQSPTFINYIYHVDKCIIDTSSITLSSLVSRIYLQFLSIYPYN